MLSYLRRLFARPAAPAASTVVAIPTELRDPQPGAVVTQFEANPDSAQSSGAMALSYNYYRED